ncbi:hypothetical protein PIB30_011205 [Stylosanthes scabra]|uniref:Uncharacterized protein n=1 Tax=Stylosanthes scabra TaxID=79078 RepID=A0ABU6S5R8_9FABA|nr:hypothetical protein [Stylosanthes scabra]
MVSITRLKVSSSHSEEHLPPRLTAAAGTELARASSSSPVMIAHTQSSCAAGRAREESGKGIGGRSGPERKSSAASSLKGTNSRTENLERAAADKTGVSLVIGLDQTSHLPLAKDTVPSCEPRDTNLAHAKLIPALDFQPERLGVKVSVGKSIVSPTGAREFAKRFRVDKMTIDLSPLSMKKAADVRSELS